MNAAENGWDIAASYGEVMAHFHATSFINSNRDPKKNPAPFTLPAPWPEEGKAEEVTPEERAALRAKLLRHSAFAR